MNPARHSGFTVTFILLLSGISHAGLFETIQVNRRTENDRSNGYFKIHVGDGAHGRLNFTVPLKKNRLDDQVSTSLSRIEIIEGGQAVAWIPTDRRDRKDGKGHFLNFQLTPEVAEKSVLVLVELTGNASGNVYRIDLFSYTKKGMAQAQPLFDEIVRFEFPKDGYQFTRAEAAKGIKISYKIIVARDFPGVIPMPFGPSWDQPAGPSLLHPREQISGNGQRYGVFDSGLGKPPREIVQTLKKGTYLHSFDWDGRNWDGPSDTDNPKGEYFPTGTYDLKIRIHGKRVTGEKGNVPYELVGKTKLTLK